MNRYLLALCLCLFCNSALRAVSNEELRQLEDEMQKYFETEQKEQFIKAANKLKAASKEADEERLFYEGWGSQGLYEAIQQEFQKALSIAADMMNYAKEVGSTYGEYAAMHTEAMVLLQMEDYDAAEPAFLKAVDFRHRHFPNESAAEDLRELLKIANIHGDIAKAKAYGNQILAEPNLAPHHKGRTLYRLSIIAFEEDDVEEFNHIYDEMNKLTKTDGIRTVNLFTELNFHIINGDFRQALLLVDQLSPDTCAERKAIIYHRMGNDEKAYEYMVLYKHISDSLTLASHSKQVGDLYLRMNNDRLRLEEEMLANQNSKLSLRYYITVGICIILVLLILIYQCYRVIKRLRHHNTMLDSGKQDAERTLTDLKELSKYEGMTELPLTTSVKVNKLCDHLADITQKHSSRDVTTIFQTDYPDYFEVKTNSAALEKVLSRLLSCSYKFTDQGLITLKCVDLDERVRFCITYSSMGTKSLPAGNSEENHDAQDNSISMTIAVCQSICRLLLGSIWMDTDYNGGTRFYFEIPKQP